MPLKVNQNQIMSKIRRDKYSDLFVLSEVSGRHFIKMHRFRMKILVLFCVKLRKGKRFLEQRSFIRFSLFITVNYSLPPPLIKKKREKKRYCIFLQKKKKDLRIAYSPPKCGSSSSDRCQGFRTKS